MKYIVLPKSVLDEVPQETLNELHLVPRVSTDGTKVIMKVVNYEKIFPPIMPISEIGDSNDVVSEPSYSYPTYEGDSLDELLKGSEWNTPDSIDTDTILDKPVVQSSKTRKSSKAAVL